MLYELSYENERRDEIKFGGLKYGFADILNNADTPQSDGEYMLMDFEGFGEVAADIQMQKAPYQDGETFIDTSLGVRPLSVEFLLSAKDFEALSALRRNVGRVFNPKLKGKLSINYNNNYYEIDCVPESVPSFPKGGIDSIGHKQTVIVNFVAPNPHWKTQSLLELPAFESLFRFPSSLYWNKKEDGDLYFEMGIQRDERIIDNVGDAAAPFQIVFYGPADSPMIENVTTGEFIPINKRLEEKQQLKIDTADGVKSVIYVDEDGEESNVFHWIDLSSTFFKLGLGENHISCNCAVSNNEKDFDIYYKFLYNSI